MYGILDCSNPRAYVFAGKILNTLLNITGGHEYIHKNLDSICKLKQMKNVQAYRSEKGHCDNCVPTDEKRALAHDCRNEILVAYKK